MNQRPGLLRLEIYVLCICCCSLKVICLFILFFAVSLLRQNFSVALTVLELRDLPALPSNCWDYKAPQPAGFLCLRTILTFLFSSTLLNFLPSFLEDFEDSPMRVLYDLLSEVQTLKVLFIYHFSWWVIFCSLSCYESGSLRDPPIRQHLRF